MSNIFGSVHYNSIGAWLRKEFGGQVSKLSFDAGFTCPNRDGSKGTGGCLFCAGDGSGHFAGQTDDPEGQIRLLSRKWPEGKYLAYFQNYTGTYAPVEELKRIYEDALSLDGVVGLAITTRPDCLPPETLNLIADLSRRTFLWVELGLQTIHDTTAKAMNRCYPTSTYDQAVKDLKNAGIPTVVHLIFGLPGETREDMLSSVRHVAARSPFGIKLHQLYLMEGSRLAEMVNSEGSDQTFIPFMQKEEYINLIVDALELLPQSVTIHRLTGDAPGSKLLAPMWTKDKHAVLNGIQQEFKRRGTWQGIYSPSLPSL